MNRHTMGCNELVELVTLYLDGALDVRMRARFESHLLQCGGGCQNYLEQLRAAVRTVARIHDEQLDPAFRNRLLDTFRDFR